MAKFTLNLRKSFAVTRFSRMGSESEISGPLVYPPASLEDALHQDSSDTLPSIKPKQGFSFPWNKRRTDQAVTRLVEKPNARGIGKKLGLRGRRTKSSPGLRDSESKETPRFVTLFLRRSSPSWRNLKRELHIRSDTLAQSPALAAEETSSESQACDPTPNRSPRDPKPDTGLQDFFGHEWTEPGSRSGGDVVSSVSETSKGSNEVGCWSNFPIPPIIISSPTLPDALCFPENSNEGSWQLPRRADSELKKSSDLEEPTNFGVVAKTLQSAARQLANDPSTTQTNIFRLSAPITAFLYALGIGVTILKREGVIFEPSTRASRIAFYTFVIPLGMLLVLALLRGVLWVISRLGRSFCELDLEEIFARGIFVDSEGQRLTEADFIVGNLIT